MKGVRRVAAVVVVVAVLGPAHPAAAGPSRALPKPVPCEECWHPAARMSWQWQLRGKIDLSVRAHMFDVDMFDTPGATVKALHRKGRVAVCYVDAGTWESWRPDADRFPKSVLGAKNGWPGERWLDIRKRKILGPILGDRMDLCASMGFDGVEFDNVDGYANHTGFRLTAANQFRFDVWLANQAHRRGLSVALKNDLDQIPTLLKYFDFALDEQCFQYSECGRLTRFVDAGKAVFEVEYSLPRSKFCPKANRMDFNSLRKRPGLGPWRRACRP